MKKQTVKLPANIIMIIWKLSSGAPDTPDTNPALLEITSQIKLSVICLIFKMRSHYIQCVMREPLSQETKLVEASSADALRRSCVYYVCVQQQISEPGD